MGTAFGIWNNLAGEGQSQRSAVPVSNASGGPAGSNDKTTGSSSAAITANDFLLLLVTEMKNQDPTANTDPNEYINQLVQVNSLQQLISINETLTADSVDNPPTSQGSEPKASDSLSGLHPTNLAAHAHSTAIRPGTGQLRSDTSSPASAERYASGNLTVPATSPAAQRVAESLGGKPKAL
jgi:flagellar basal-body rod modification protein FlgD